MSDTANRLPTALDVAMPTWSSREYHQLAIASSSAPVMPAVEQLTWREVPGFHRIVRIAGLGTKRFPPDGRVIDLLLDGPYRVVFRSADEIVIGGILPLKRDQRLPDLGPQPLRAFAEFSCEGAVKVAVNFTSRDGILSTETRNLPVGRRARVLFAAYWAAIRAGSGLIRRSWLKGIRRRVERTVSLGG